MHIKLSVVWQVLARAFLNTAGRQRWTVAKVLNYVAVVAVALAIAWYTGQIQALQEKSLAWVLLVAAAGIVFFVEMLIQSYVAAYEIGKESGGVAAPKIDLEELKRLYREGQGFRNADRQQVRDWSRAVSAELNRVLPAERFGFDTASDSLGQLRAMGMATPHQHLQVRLTKLRLIVMRTENPDADND